MGGHTSDNDFSWAGTPVVFCYNPACYDLLERFDSSDRVPARRDNSRL